MRTGPRICSIESSNELGKNTCISKLFEVFFNEFKFNLRFFGTYANQLGLGAITHYHRIWNDNSNVVNDSNQCPLGFGFTMQAMFGLHSEMCEERITHTQRDKRTIHAIAMHHQYHLYGARHMCHILHLMYVLQLLRPSTIHINIIDTVAHSLIRSHTRSHSNSMRRFNSTNSIQFAHVRSLCIMQI